MIVKDLGIPNCKAVGVGIADPNTCACGRPRLPGETGCAECMKSILGFLYRNALNGWIKMSRYDEVVRKILAAGPV